MINRNLKESGYKAGPVQQFEEKGFVLLRAEVSDADVNLLLESIERLGQTYRGEAAGAGIRRMLTRSTNVRRFARSARLLDIAKSVLGEGARPVKAILFDKTPGTNWYVTWHQDLTIAVKNKIESPGFGPWSIKDETPHVQPPAEVLQNMVALRVHLDDCPVDNGPIKFIPGSHANGIMEAQEIALWRDQQEHVCCAVLRGDIILMRPLILHSSSQATQPEHRRVLHIEYSGADLPDGLEWAEGSALDGVELLMAIEEEFGLDIPDKAAENLTTVGQMYQYIRERNKTMPPMECLSQKIFYKLRRALIANYGLSRHVITPDTILTDLLTREQIEQGWPFMQLFIDLKTPPFKVAHEKLLFRVADRMLTMRELVAALITINAEKLFPDATTDDAVWNRLVTVIVNQLNIPRHEIVPEASFTRDLGIC